MTSSEYQTYLNFSCFFLSNLGECWSQGKGEGYLNCLGVWNDGKNLISFYLKKCMFIFSYAQSSKHLIVRKFKMHARIKSQALKILKKFLMKTIETQNHAQSQIFHEIYNCMILISVISRHNNSVWHFSLWLFWVFIENSFNILYYCLKTITLINMCH